MFLSVVGLVGVSASRSSAEDFDWLARNAGSLFTGFSVWRRVVGDNGDDPVRDGEGGTLAARGNEPGPNFGP